MENDEKIRYINALNEIKKGISGCFGVTDRKWGHALDENRAKVIRKIANDNNVLINDVQDIILGFFYRIPTSMEHLKVESDKAMIFFKKTLK